jgi:hypothetical protein
MINYKKIASVLASTVLLGSTVGIAAAASYPAPFVQGGQADVAVVWGADVPQGSTDLVAVADITANLQAELAKQTATTGGTTSTVSGEAYPLFSSGDNKIYYNDSLRAQRDTVTDSDMPKLLADTDFSGNVDAQLIHIIKIGPNPSIAYSQQPTSDDDPQFNLGISTSSSNYIYNATITLDKAVNFTHADSVGEDVTLFGQRFTVGSGTDATNLVLFKSSDTMFLTSDANPSETVTVNGEEYTVTLITASDTSATVRLTDSSGNTDQKEINEAASKKILGIEVSINLANEDTAQNIVTAEVTVGADKLKLANGNEVLVGSDEDAVDGTNVVFTGNPSSGLTEITVQVAADDTDRDAILPGGVFVDPVFGSFKIDFSSLANNANREMIKVSNSGDDKVDVKLSQGGVEKTINWVYNVSAITHPEAATPGIPVLGDSGGDLIHVVENAIVNKSHYVVVGNDENGRLLEVKTITNSSTGFSNDKVVFQDVISGESQDLAITADGTGTLSIGGSTYTVTYEKDLVDTTGYVRINDPDSTAAGDVNIFPTIETTSGARVAFYQPTVVDLNNVDASGTNATSLRFPDGDGYTAVTAAPVAADATNFTIGSVQLNATGQTTTATIGRLTYTFGFHAANKVNVTLQGTSGSLVDLPALVIFEEEDDNNNYEAMIVRLEGLGTSANGLGVTDVDSTSGFETFITHETNTDISSASTLFGSLLMLDSSESDQKTLEISYPEDQVYAEIYVAEEAASISGGSSGSGSVKELGSVSIKDTEVASRAAGKNLIVIGGSCINDEAASLLGVSDGTCGPDFTEATTVESGQFLIETFSRSGGAVATLIAGYNAQDTLNAATYLRTQSVMTDANAKYVGTSSTSATLETA